MSNENEKTFLITIERRQIERRRQIRKNAPLKSGSGVRYFNNSNQLFDRLALLAGSCPITAGNNGVKNEFSEIAHTLRNMGLISQTDLNKL